MKPKKTVLVFPPFSTEIYFPEIGMPRLAAFLGANGVECDMIDLNVIFPEFLMNRDNVIRLIQLHKETYRADRESAVNRDVLTDAESALREYDCNYIFRHFIHDLIKHRLKVIPSSWQMKEVRYAIEDGISILEEFFQEHFFKNFDPDVKLVGISVVGSTQVVSALMLSRMIKMRRRNVKIVLGGPWCTAAQDIIPGFMKQFDQVDYVIIQGGEKPLLSLLNALAGDGDVGRVSNLFYRNNGDIIRTGIEANVPMADMPPPTFSGLPLEKYTLPILSFQTVNHCHWSSCVFCDVETGQPVKEMLDPARAADMMIGLSEEYGVKRFFMGDRSAHPDIIGGMADRLIERKSEIEWATMARAEPWLTPGLCEKLKKSGLRGLRVGLETVSKRGLEYINKGISLKNVENLISACSDTGLKLQLFIMDYPTCTEDELKATFDFLDRNMDRLAGFSFTRFTLIRTSRIFRRPEDYGLRVPPDVDQYLDVFDLPFESDIYRYEGRELIYMDRIRKSRPGGDAAVCSWDNCY